MTICVQIPTNVYPIFSWVHIEFQCVRLYIQWNVNFLNWLSRNKSWAKFSESFILIITKIIEILIEKIRGYKFINPLVEYFASWLRQSMKLKTVS